jgi:hypothetical protein|tara:strand:- start:2422 stop:3426 length:1005 start_codon:yes stop_codon:yes gene_type:complete
MLNEEQLKAISGATLKKTAEIGLKHARENLPYIENTIRDIKKDIFDKPAKPALVISAGPSLHLKESIESIKRSGFSGYIVTADGSLGYCLRNGVVPDYVVTVDPHPHRIIRWFGDPKLTKRPEDDYFKRQDLDPVMNNDEVTRNDELIELVNGYGSQIKAVISTSVSPEITKRCIEAGMDLYWWNPLYDDYERPESCSKRVYQQNKVPCMVTGGNVGTSAWVFSHVILNSPEVLLVGMDFSYPPGTNVKNTQYYDMLKEIFFENPEKGLIEIYNPYLKETWITDLAYCWYNEIFLKMVPLASCKTYNCTEGGILFGKGVEFVPLSTGLERITSG